MDPTERDIIGRVPQISFRVEGFFHAQPVILHQMPFLGLLGDEPAFANRDDESLVIDLVCIPSKEVKQELTQRLLVHFAETTERLEIVGERGRLSRRVE